MTQPVSPHKHDPFANVQPPALPKGLRHRVLAGARRAAHQQPTMTDRLWESPRLRLAWAAMVVLLLGIQVYLAPPPSAEVVGRVTSLKSAVSSSDEPELRRFLARHSTGETATLVRFNGSQLFGSITIDPLS